MCEISQKYETLFFKGQTRHVAVENHYLLKPLRISETLNFLLPVAPADTASTTSKQASHVVDVKEPKKKKKKVGCLGNY